MRTFEGNVVAENNMRIGIVAARFNEFITSKLVAGAQDALRRHNVSEEDVDVAWVPGAFEIPLIASSVPVMFGVLTTDTIEQAIERAGTKSGNKGFDCAMGAIEMVNLVREIRK